MKKLTILFAILLPLSLQGELKVSGTFSPVP